MLPVPEVVLVRAMTAAPPAKNYRGSRGPCLVAYRPNLGVASVAVKTIEDVHRAMVDWCRFIGGSAYVEWWVEPNALPVWAGGSAMDAEQKRAIEEKAAKCSPK